MRFGRSAAVSFYDQPQRAESPEAPRYYGAGFFLAAAAGFQHSRAPGASVQMRPKESSAANLVGLTNQLFYRASLMANRRIILRPNGRTSDLRHGTCFSLPFGSDLSDAFSSGANMTTSLPDALALHPCPNAPKLTRDRAAILTCTIPTAIGKQTSGATNE